ncbi:60Kd inner membrane protein-domain-containing protein [Aspergillus karnatakaensis]|uniref:membrane insertase OXA1 n=1 Tax=Aspergillus karnatakaensis TaxID=1810916 RepID=UPI003CCDF49C
MFGGPAMKGRIAQQQFAAFAKSNRSMSSFRPQISRLPVRNGKNLSGRSLWKPMVPSIAVAARFNSTSPTPPPLENADVTSSTPAQNSLDWDLFDLSSVPETIGYLKTIGLDYGYGPSAMVQWLMEHFHIWGGLPWLGSIAATGFLIRFAMLPMFMRSADTGARINNSKHLTAPLRQQMIQAAQQGNNIRAQEVKAELSKVQTELGIKPVWAFLPLFVQIPFGYGCYRVINGMTTLPVPSLAAEKFLWISDFTVPDPYFLLPILTSVFLHVSLKKGGEMGPQDPKMVGMRKMLVYGMPAVQLIFMCFFPAATQFYFMNTGFFGLCQALMFSSPSFRRATGMTQLIDPNKLPASGASGAPDSRSLRLLTEIAEREKAQQASPEKPSNDPKTSFIDRTINSIKESKDSITKDATEKIDEMRGAGPKKNADGTVIEERLSEKDRKLAEDYEKRRKEEDDWKREERNHARREAHQKRMAQERENARRALKRKQ